MFYKIEEILKERKIENGQFPVETLYKVGMESVKNNIEFYFDKTYTCESVIKQLFIEGVIQYIESKNNEIDDNFPYLVK